MYYRLAVIDIELPSLQERGRKELQELITFFIREKKKAYQKKYSLDAPRPVMDKILTYPFPGNIRELENLIERLYVLCPGGKVQVDDLPRQILNPPKPYSLLLNDIEKWHIEKVLKMNKGNQRKTARDIGRSYNTLMAKLDKYGIEKSEHQKV